MKSASMAVKWLYGCGTYGVALQNRNCEADELTVAVDVAYDGRYVKPAAREQASVKCGMMMIFEYWLTIASTMLYIHQYNYRGECWPTVGEIERAGIRLEETTWNFIFQNCFALCRDSVRRYSLYLCRNFGTVRDGNAFGGSCAA
jgi:hypothetical protein